MYPIGSKQINTMRIEAIPFRLVSWRHSHEKRTWAASAASFGSAVHFPFPRAEVFQSEIDFIYSWYNQIMSCHDYSVWEIQITICLNFKLSAGSTCLRAGPCSTVRTLLAKLSELRVSPESIELGLICTNIRVLQSPPVKMLNKQVCHLVVFLELIISLLKEQCNCHVSSMRRKLT